MSLLEVQNLSIAFGDTTVVDGLDLRVERGQTLGLVGESGCGKSVTAMALMGLLPARSSSVTGSIRFDGTELVGRTAAEWRAWRGKRIAMVFQDPMTALNPLLSVGQHMHEVLQLHTPLRGEEAHKEAVRWLDRVGIPDASSRLRAWPHELSGGMRQRILIALALASGPELLLADEPTTALDVTIQAQILHLLQTLQKELGMSMIFVTHDLGVVERIADHLAVLYAGRVIETGRTETVLQSPSHPYTRGLLGSVPGFRPRTGPLVTIAGTVPSPRDWPQGCRFQSRCTFVQDPCRQGSAPVLRTVRQGVPHQSACPVLVPETAP